MSLIAPRSIDLIAERSAPTRQRKTDPTFLSPMHRSRAYHRLAHHRLAHHRWARHRWARQVRGSFVSR